MKRKHTEKSAYVSAPVMPTSVQEDLSDVSDDFEDTYNTEVANIQTQLDQLDNKTHPGNSNILFVYNWDMIDRICENS